MRWWTCCPPSALARELLLRRAQPASVPAKPLRTQLQQPRCILLGRLPGNRPICKEEDEAAGALPIVDISGKITVRVAQQLGNSFISSSWTIVQPPMHCPCYIAEHPLDCSKVLFMRRFHESTQIAHCICQVGSGVAEVPETADEAAVLSGINTWSRPSFSSFSFISMGVALGL